MMNITSTYLIKKLGGWKYCIVMGSTRLISRRYYSSVTSASTAMGIMIASMVEIGIDDSYHRALELKKERKSI